MGDIYLFLLVGTLIAAYVAKRLDRYFRRNMRFAITLSVDLHVPKFVEFEKRLMVELAQAMAVPEKYWQPSSSHKPPFVRTGQLRPSIRIRRNQP